MNFLITGGGGFLGRRLAEALLEFPGVARLVSADIAAPAGPRDARYEAVACDLAEPGAAAKLVSGADVIFHLAAVVSGQAEAEFGTGMRVNLDATRALLEAARTGGRRPRLVFASSLAVFGPPLPAVVTDETAVNPRSSYGTQKAIGELLVCDYSRKGFIDGRVLRLPTVCVRPGAPNAAASSFVSGIIREPLSGKRALCPVDRTQELWLSSPKAAVANLIRGAAVPGEELGERRIVNLPGLTVTVAEMISCLARVAGPEAAARVDFGEDAAVKRIVASWPARFDVSRALGLGFQADPGFEQVVRAFADEESALKRS